jgi:hypothetical protein
MDVFSRENNTNAKKTEEGLIEVDDIEINQH